jgi:signal transduction histidine kinase
LNFSFFWEITPGLRMNPSEIMIFKYILTWMWIVPIIMGLTNICMFKKKYVRIAQIIFWIFLFYVAWIIIDNAYLDFDFIIWFMWLLPLFAWITGKCITKKCMKYWEKIIKIRV